MKKDGRIKQWGAEAYKRELALSKIWKKKNPEKTKRYAAERNRVGGKHYLEARRKNMEGLRHERAKRRSRDAKKYHLYKKVIDPTGLTQVHHSWYSNSVECEGLALVEKDQHQHGYIKVIQILEGEITLFTEEFLRGGVKFNAKTNT